jgi:sugar-specific transcriptional regulator TrmB
MPRLSEQFSSEQSDFIKLGRAANLARELQNYGISEGQARIYLFLIGKPPLGARSLSGELKLHRVEAYRRLRELEKVGLVEVHLGSPMTFSAVPPSEALSELVKGLSMRVSKLKQGAIDLEKQLEEYGRANSLVATDPNANGKRDTQLYRLVVGREQYYKEMRSSLRNAKIEILRIISAMGLKRTFLLGFHREYRKAKQAGAIIRIVSEINSSNQIEARKLSKLVEMHHINDIHLRFTVIDKVTTIFRRLDDDDAFARTEEDSFLISEDQKYAEATRFFFDHLWHTSEEPKL